MALGATQALARARLTGQPQPIPNSTLVAYPNGSVGTPGGGFGGSRSAPLPLPPMPPSSPPAVTQPVAPSRPFTAAGVAGQPGSPSGPAVGPPATPPATQPSSFWQQSGVDPGWYYGAPMPTASASTQPPLNQANPNFTAGIQGLPGGPSGPAVAPPGGFPPPPPTTLPDVAVTARRYRAAHGLSTDADTDALNAESLQAAQAGRTFLDRNLAAQYGQTPAASAWGPRVDVVNALSMPPTTAQPQQQQSQLAQNALLQQGIY